MARPLKSQTRVKRLQAVFSPDDEVSAIVARLSVLFEDLRIEFTAAQIENCSELDLLHDRTYRVVYFLRRSTVTLVEFNGCFDLLDRHPSFRPLVARFDSQSREWWESAGAFFRGQKSFLKRIRDDYGGHFQLSHAKEILAEIHPDAVGTLEFRFDHVKSTVDVRLHYAYELVANGLVLHRGETDEQPYVRQLFETITNGWKHCADVLHVLVRYFVLPRFGGG